MANKAIGHYGAHLKNQPTNQAHTSRPAQLQGQKTELNFPNKPGCILKADIRDIRWHFIVNQRYATSVFLFLSFPQFQCHQVTNKKCNILKFIPIFNMEQKCPIQCGSKIIIYYPLKCWCVLLLVVYWCAIPANQFPIRFSQSLPLSNYVFFHLNTNAKKTT